MSLAKVQHKFSVTIEGGKESTTLDNNDIIVCRLFEDIYSYCKTLHLVTKDTKALHEMLPIVGDEKVTIVYQSLLEDKFSYAEKEFTFYMLKVNVANSKDRNRHHIEFFCVDSMYKKLHSWNFTRSYSDDCYTYMDIAQQILEDIAEVDLGEFENCPEKKHYFYTGMRTPIQCVKWLAERCTSDATGQPGYVMYADTYNSGEDLLNVISLETLLKKGVDMVPPLDGLYTVRSHNEYNINNIISYTVNRPDKQSLRPLLGSFELCWDIRRKKYIKVECSYKDALDKFTCLGAKSLFNTAAIDTDIGEYKKHHNVNEDDEEICKNIYYSDWIKRYCLQQTIQCSLEGHCERFAGGMIEIKWPSADDDIQVDPNMTGLFLCKSITHQWMPSQNPVYTQKMVLIKNGYHESSPKLIDAAKVNTKFTDIRSTSAGLPQG